MDLRRNACLLKPCCVYYYMILLKSRSNQDASLQCYIPRWLDFGFLVIGITFTSLGQNLWLRSSCCTWVVLSITCTGVSQNLVMLTTCATTCLLWGIVTQHSCRMYVTCCTATCYQVGDTLWSGCINGLYLDIFLLLYVPLVITCQCQAFPDCALGTHGYACNLNWLYTKPGV